MFVITADQVDSRHGRDLVGDALALVTTLGADRLALPPDRTAGDELQALTESAETALTIALALLRAGDWSVGLGIGAIRRPLPTETRAAAGTGLIRAREAVEAAKRRTPRLAIGVDPHRSLDGPTIQAVLDLLLQLRERRSAQGWELYDLVESGLSQAEAATRLGITPQAASKRAIAAGLKLDAAARVALVSLLAIAGIAPPLPTPSATPSSAPSERNTP